MQRDDAMAIGTAAVYALCFIAIKAGLAYAPPLAFGGLRALIGGAALLSAALVTQRCLLPSRRMWRWIPTIALTGTTFTYGAMFLSPMFTRAGVASVIGNIQPLFVIVLARLFLREHMTRGKWITLGMGLAGVVLFSAQYLFVTEAGTGNEIAGAALALFASLGTAISTVLFKRSGAREGSVVISGWSLVLGSVPLLLTSVIAERERSITLNATFVTTLLFLALAGTALTTAIWYSLVQRNEASRMAMYLFLIPAFGMVIARFALSEQAGWQEVAGTALIVTGMIIGARTRNMH